MIFGTLNELAEDAAVNFRNGALEELESDVSAKTTEAKAAKAGSDIAAEDLIRLDRLADENRNERDQLRSKRDAGDAAAFETWRKGERDDYAKDAKRSADLGVQIEFLNQRDIRLRSHSRPRVLLKSQRADAAYYLATAEFLHAHARVAAYKRHEALQAVVQEDGVAQLPAKEGKANLLWAEAKKYAGRAAKISQAADINEAQILLRDGTL